MEYSAESVRFLHIAYALMALGQLTYVALLARRWSRVNSGSVLSKSDDA